MTPASIGAWLLGLALPKATARKFALLGFLLFVALAGCAIWGGVRLWLHFHDKAVIEKADARRQRDEAQAALEARNRADAAEAGRAEARDAAHEATETELETIHAQDPAAAAAPASRGARAVADRLRAPRDQEHP